MSIVADFGFVILVGGLVSFGWWAGYTFLSPEFKTREYINWFKIGRVKQFAENKNIDLEIVMVKDDLRLRENNKFYRQLENTWTSKIMDKLSEELSLIKNEEITKNQEKIKAKIVAKKNQVKRV